MPGLGCVTKMGRENYDCVIETPELECNDQTHLLGASILLLLFLIKVR